MIIIFLQSALANYKVSSSALEASPFETPASVLKKSLSSISHRTISSVLNIILIRWSSSGSSTVFKSFKSIALSTVSNPLYISSTRRCIV